MPRDLLVCASFVICFQTLSAAQSLPGTIVGHVVDETGGAMPGVTVELRSENDGGEPLVEVTDGTGDYTFVDLAPGRYQVAFTLVNFASVTRRGVEVAQGSVRIDATLQLSLSAEVVVMGKRTFANLADVENPAENLVGIAQSASQGAITAKQLDVRPFMRQGEVLETVPGVIVTQHSGEGKANQYYLRGFNLDHGSDFATTIAATPANMPTHAHSQGYSDVNFLIPELVAGVQYSKGPYYTDQGDFATAGAANINYASLLDRPLARIEGGTYGFGRGVFAASPRVGRGYLLGAFEVSTNDGPWDVPDSYKKLNGVLRYSLGEESVNGFSLTAMGYHGTWNATEATPQRAIEAGLVGRYGTLDPTDGGHTSRYSLATEWQRGTGQTLTKVTAFGLKYDLDLISNFTFFLDDPVRGDQQEQVDHRFVTGAKAFQRRISHWGKYSVQNSYGVQMRYDRVDQVALYHTENRVRLATRSDDSVNVTTAGVYGENQIEWSGWLRTTIGLRGDASHYGVDDKLIAQNSGTSTAGIVSPKAGAIFGPWKSTEFYANAGTGFHSNDARGTTLLIDASGNLAERVTPLVRAKGAEVGARTVAIRHLQTTVSLWTLRLGSELVYNGDVGATEPGPGSKRYGVEFANYYSPLPWLIFDGDVSKSQARFTSFNEEGPYVPEAVDTVVSGGASIDNFHRTFGSLRLRYFGPRPLVADNSVRSKSTTLLNLEGGYQVSRYIRVNVEVFNLANAVVSDIDYYFASRLPGEPAQGVEDIHTHPAVPRTTRVSMVVGF